MGKKNNTKKIYRHKLLASTLTCLFLMPQAACLNAMATDITGVKPDIDGHTYNVRPDGYHGDIGFKKYENFNVSQGDVVNMIFQYFQSGGSVDADGITHYFKTQDVSTFVNLVQNQINIQGVVNALQSENGGLSNGHLIFVSPGGMVVGASGVLNVGSLSVYTPDSNSFNKFYNTVETAAQTIANDGVTSATCLLQNKRQARNARRRIYAALALILPQTISKSKRILLPLLLRWELFVFKFLKWRYQA